MKMSKETIGIGSAVVFGDGLGTLAVGILTKDTNKIVEGSTEIVVSTTLAALNSVRKD
jgi:hypothetical protein